MKLYLTIISLSLLPLLTTGCGDGGNLRKEELKTRLEPYSKPAAEFEGQFGDYRSPLLFDNGKAVEDLEGWITRKEEIREYWFGKIGQWPEILTDQEMELTEAVDCGEYTRYRAGFLWTPNEKTSGYLLLPKAKGRKPAVITVFYEPETALGLTEKKDRDWAVQLVKRGFAVLSIGTAETTAQKVYSLYYPSRDSASMQPLSTLAYAAANAWEVLARHPEVDPSRIGIMGHSYGGKWAMFASCLYEKFACAAWGDPGIVFDETKGSYINYWEPWYLGYYPPP